MASKHRMPVITYNKNLRRRENRRAVFGGGKLGTLGADQASEYGYSAPPGEPWLLGGSPNYFRGVLNIFPAGYLTPLEEARVESVLYGPEDITIIESDGSESRLPEKEIPVSENGSVPPKGGCWALVHDEVGVTNVNLLEPSADTENLAFADSRVKAKISEWSLCMKSLGYKYDSVFDPQEEHASFPTRESIDTAVADVKCTEESRWPDTYYAVLADYQRQAIAKDPALFDAAIASERKLLERINELGY